MFNREFQSSKFASIASGPSVKSSSACKYALIDKWMLYPQEISKWAEQVAFDHTQLVPLAGSKSADLLQVMRRESGAHLVKQIAIQE